MLTSPHEDLTGDGFAVTPKTSRRASDVTSPACPPQSETLHREPSRTTRSCHSSSWRSGRSAASANKRYFAAERLADELGRGEVLFEGRWFVVVRA
jgi:hypothetical protein